MTALLLTVFVASLVGSVHCAGMCGGIVTLCVSGKPVDRGRSWMPQTLYNIGRGVMYAALGSISGALGAAVDIGGSAVGWSRVATWIAGAAMILIGGAALLETFGIRFRILSLPAPVKTLFQRGMSATQRLPIGWKPFFVGLLTGLLPCGWLYAFVISAAGTGSWWLGAATMAAFWAGTLPVMLGLGFGAQKLCGALRQQLPRVTACILVVVGFVTILGRLGAPAYAELATRHAVRGDVAEQVRSLDAGNMPCCHDHP